ncbi:DNA-binding response regulator [Chromatiales bacterium (ex Bugula neritina AB1)]|nr:DNA-binding response regulator [Chromatiales bacterium (ex Bugula neritina AB1)]
MRYLLVEDNMQLASAIAERLQVAGHVIDHAADLASAAAFVRVVEYDLILLDIMLPDGDGRQFLEQHRARYIDTPVVVLTARSEVSDRVRLLDLGADDYLVKPFDFSELEARCRAVLRRRSGGTSNTIQLGDLFFDALTGTITVAESTITLRNKELRLLEILVCAPNQIFSKEKLIDRLFPYNEDVSTNAIEVYIARLRKHLQESSVNIVTVRGLGYKLAVP